MPKKVDISAVVAEATVLARKVKEDTSRLEELKKHIRTEAVKLANKRCDDELVEFPSPEGNCTVVFPNDSIVIKKGVDPYIARDELPEPVWSLLFEEKVTLAPDFKLKLANLPHVSGFTLNSRCRAIIESLVENRENSPRVILAK